MTTQHTETDTAAAPTPADKLPETGPGGRPRRTARPVEIVIDTATVQYLDAVRSEIAAMDPQRLVQDLLNYVNISIAGENDIISIENARDKAWVLEQNDGKGKDDPKIAVYKKKPLPEVTSPGFAQIARIIMTRHHVVNITPSERNSDPDLDMLAIYEDDPSSPHHGTYRTSLSDIEAIARRYTFALTTKDFTEMLALMRSTAPRRTRGSDPDLIAVANGVFNYKTKQLLPFTPDEIFLSKAAVRYNPDAENITIHNDADGTDWDVESWMNELSDDPEIVGLLWEIIGAIVRPYVSWNKSAWFYSEQGNNGKGTLVELMRNICGPQSYASIPLSDFGKDFMLEPLTRANAILVDENDVGTFVDKAANLKAIITGDVISINRKFKTPIAYQFRGFMVQCLNEFPKIKDKSESFHRRQIFVPFTKCFTGAERRYIKDDYLNRDAVLEYVLKRVLHMNYYTLSTPDAVVKKLNEFKEYNDPIRSFWNENAELLSAGSWNLLPFQYLYDLFKVWFSENMPSGKPVGRNSFMKDLAALVNADTTEWICTDTSTRHRRSDRMAGPQRLSLIYGLDNWINENQPMTNPDARSTPVQSRLRTHYAGLLRDSENNQDLLDAAAEPIPGSAVTRASQETTAPAAPTAPATVPATALRQYTDRSGHHVNGALLPGGTTVTDQTDSADRTGDEPEIPVAGNGLAGLSFSSAADVTDTGRSAGDVTSPDGYHDPVAVDLDAADDEPSGVNGMCFDTADMFADDHTGETDEPGGDEQGR